MANKLKKQKKNSFSMRQIAQTNVASSVHQIK